MLTPIEIQSKTFKTGFGYDKKDVESFLKDVVSDYEVLYKENMELKDKMGVLSEGVQYYKSIEKTLQKALVLAQKAAQETEANATAKAENIVTTATNKATKVEEDANVLAAKIINAAKENADNLLVKARQELEHIQIDVANLLQQYEKYKVQYKQLINTQMEILDSPAYNVDYSNFLTFHSFISSKLEMPKVEEVAETPVVAAKPAEVKEEVKEEIKEEAKVEVKAEVKEEPVQPVVETPVVKAETEVKEEVTEVKEEVKEETKSEQEEAHSPVLVEDDFMPEIDLDGILDDIDLEEEPASESVSNSSMKELTATESEESPKETKSIEETLNQLSEKELLMKLFSTAKESGLKAKKSDDKDDFEFLDL